MKVSMEGYSFWELMEREHMDIFGFLETLAYRYRARGAGLWNAFFDGQSERRELSNEYVDLIARKLRELNLELPNLHCDNCCVCYPNEEEQASAEKYAWHMLEVGAKLGAKSARIDWGVREETLSPAQEERIVRMYRRFCAFGAEHGMKVGPENHFGASMRADLFTRVSGEIESPAYGVLLHLGRWAAGTPTE